MTLFSKKFSNQKKNLEDNHIKEITYYTTSFLMASYSKIANLNFFIIKV